MRRRIDYPWAEVIDVLFFSDREVKQKLFARVDAAKRPLIVSQTRTDRFARPVTAREPFVSLNAEFGDLVDVVVVADEGSTEGMWRDPVGDLADRFFPWDKNAAYAAQTGYMLIAGGKVRATVKKRGAKDDLWFLQEALAQHVPGIPQPHPSLRPGQKAERPPRAAPRDPFRESPFREPPRAHRSSRAAPPRADTPPQVPALVEESDPWALLGIAPGTPLPEAKRAFRNLIARYHPDKVAHLAPEFRELAERKTREILDAWRQIEEEGG